MMSVARTLSITLINVRALPPEEAVDRVSLILTGEDRLYQGGEFVRSEYASDQTSTGRSVEAEIRGAIGIPYKIGAGVAKDAHSRTRRLQQYCGG